MANTLDSDLIVSILAERAMNTLPSALNPLRVFSTDFSDDRAVGTANGPRQPIVVELVSTAGNAISNPTNFAVTEVVNSAVTVNPVHLSRPVGLTAQDLNQSRRLMTKADKALESIANAIMDTCMSLVTEDGYPNTPIDASGGFTDATLKQMWASVSNSSVKNAVLSGLSYANFIPKNLSDFDPTKGSTGIFGFDNFVYNNRFTAAGEDIVAFACAPSAMAVASRLPADPGGAKASDYIVTDTVTIDPLGIAVEFNVWFDRNTRGHWLSYDVVFGAARGDTSALTVVSSAAPTTPSTPTTPTTPTT